MHEYSIVQALFDRVVEASSAYENPRITEVRISIGELAGVETGLLRKAYEAFRERTPLERAELVIESVAARWACPDCGAAIAAGVALRCDVCDRPARLIAGDEILLERVAMEVT